MVNNNSKAPPPGNLPTQGAPASAVGVANKNINDVKQRPAPSTKEPELPKSVQPQPRKSQQGETAPVSRSETNPGVKPDISLQPQIQNQPKVEAPKQVNIKPPVEPSAELDTKKPDEIQQLDDTTVESLEKRSRIIRLIILVISALVIVGLVIAGIYVYNNWLKTATLDTTSDQKEAEVQEQETVESDDRDEDLLPNEWEEKYGLNPDDSSDASKDNDFDGLTNLEEYKYKTNPKDSDTDKDGYADGQEVELGYDPAGTGKLENDNQEEVISTAFLAGSWSGTMQGQNYNFSDLSISIRSDGKLLLSYNVIYNEEVVANEGLGEFEVEREINSIKSQIDMQGVAKSGSGTYLFGFNGTLGKNNDEISGTWYIIPSSLTAPWMIQDKGTFSWKIVN